MMIRLESYLGRVFNLDMVAAENLQVYFDMDGVLADFIGGVERDSGVVAATEGVEGLLGDREAGVEEFREGMRRLDRAKRKASLKPGFFLGLDVLPGAIEMLDVAARITGGLPHILTAPMPVIKQRMLREKRRWMREHFDGMYNRFIGDRDKWKYADGMSILIDDKLENIEGWIQHGGIGILHGDPNGWKGSLSQLVKVVDAARNKVK